MSPNASESTDESFCNDSSQQRQDSNHANEQDTQQDNPSKAKRIACVLCRKRKLRCDGARPTCSTCKRMSHDCAYNEVRKKSGPKRGYVKLLEQRLQQVETLLKTQDTTDTRKDATHQDSASAYVANTVNLALPNAGDCLDTGATGRDAGQKASWDLISLGLEEPLPPQEVTDDLYQIYFSKVHLTMPMIHRRRFLAALNLAPHVRPPICLRYIMWTLAASITDKYEGLQHHFYQRSRKYAQMDEMRSHGESTVTLAHCQAWILTCTYEFKMMYFPRAWMSAGRAARLAQMMQLHRLDGAGLDVKQCLPPPKDWTEREERRRSFWMSFCIDRYASIGTGWPMTIDERDIMTNLPASEEAFEKSIPMPTGSLEQVLQPNGATNIQSFGGIVLTAAMLGRNLLHLYRPEPEDNEDDINGGFWSRHRNIEQILLQVSLGLPDHLRLPCGLADPNVVFTNMCIHTSAICLHQAAIFKAEKYQLPASVSNESKIRCVTAAAEIASVMRSISHMDLGARNPFISFCVYVAARVFVQYLRTRPKDQQVNSSLQFLLQAMHALRRKNPLTDSFLAQLDVDLESAGMEGMRQKSSMSTPIKVNQNPESLQGASNGISDGYRVPVSACKNPVVNVSDSQDSIIAINTFGEEEPVFTAPRSSTQYSNNTPDPPFHLTNINSVDLHIRNAAFMAAQASSRADFGNGGYHDFTPGGFAFHEGNEMDLSGGDGSVDHASPATMSSQSRGGSTCHSSHSPGRANDSRLRYRASPKMPYSGMWPGAATATAFAGMLSASEASATNHFGASGNIGNEGFNDGFSIGNEWDYAALDMGTGLTPMPDASWDAMLQSATMGWDSAAHTHDSQRHASGAR